MLSILCVRLTIKVKVGIPESFKVGWYPPKKTGSSHLNSTQTLFFAFQIVIDKVTGNHWSGSIAVGITTKTIPLLTVPASVMDLREGTWLMTGSCVMKDAVVVKENYGHSLDRLQVINNYCLD